MTEGVYPGLSEAAYRSAEGVSQSLLKEFIAAATPLHFKHREPKVPTPDMEFGTLVHGAVLTPDIFPSLFHLRPETYPAEVKGKTVQKPWNGNSEWCKDWLDKHSDRIAVTRERFSKIAPIRERLLKMPEFSSALESGQTEVAFFKDSPEFGVKLKGRCDLVATEASDETWIFDLKKVQSGCATESEFGKQAYNLGYDIQAAFYLDLTGASHFVFVVFDDDKPFDAILWKPEPDFIRCGRERYLSALRWYSECAKKGEWPGYAAGFNRLKLPQWVRQAAT